MAGTTSDFVQDLVCIEKWLSNPARMNKLALLLEKWRTEGEGFQSSLAQPFS